MACLLYSWIIGYLRVSDRFYGAGAMLGLSLYLPGWAVVSGLPFMQGGYIAAILSTQVFNSSSSLFPLLLLEMLIAGAVCGVLGILVGIPAFWLRGICWRSLLC